MVEVTQADSGFTPNGIAAAEMLWANLPIRRKFQDLPTHEKALVCHTVARLTATAALADENAALRAELNEQARIVGMSAERELTLRAENAARIEALEGAVKALCRVLGPVNMTLAQQECIDEPLSRDTVILSFMGSGASDSVTVGDFEDAMNRAIAALAGDPS